MGAREQCEKERLAYTKCSELTITTITDSHGLLRGGEKKLSSEFEAGKNLRCGKSVSNFGFAFFFIFLCPTLLAISNELK